MLGGRNIVHVVEIVFPATIIGRVEGVIVRGEERQLAEIKPLLEVERSRDKDLARDVARERLAQDTRRAGQALVCGFRRKIEVELVLDDRPADLSAELLAVVIALFVVTRLRRIVRAWESWIQTAARFF